MILRKPVIKIIKKIIETEMWEFFKFIIKIAYFQLITHDQSDCNPTNKHYMEDSQWLASAREHEKYIHTC